MAASRLGAGDGADRCGADGALLPLPGGSVRFLGRPAPAVLFLRLRLGGLCLFRLLCEEALACAGRIDWPAGRVAFSSVASTLAFFLKFQISLPQAVGIHRTPSRAGLVRHSCEPALPVAVRVHRTPSAALLNIPARLLLAGAGRIRRASSFSRHLGCTRVRHFKFEIFNKQKSRPAQMPTPTEKQLTNN